MTDRNRARLQALIAVAIVGLFLMAIMGCGAIAGVGRDITAMADGMAEESANNSRKIRGKDE